jgi:hypothetical protein
VTWGSRGLWSALRASCCRDGDGDVGGDGGAEDEGTGWDRHSSLTVESVRSRSRPR